MSLLDYNYTHLNQYMRILVYEQRKVFHLRPCEIQRIDEKKYPLALEFYLQFDGMYSDSSHSIISFPSLYLSFFYFSSQYVLYENMFISLCATTYTQ